MVRYNLGLLLLIHLLFGLAQAQGVGSSTSKKKIKEDMLRVAQWQLAHPKHDLWDWTNGAFYAGLFSAYQTTRSPEMLKALVDMGERNGWKPGPRFDHADDLAITQTYLDLYRLKKDRRMLQPTFDVVNKLRKQTGDEVAKHGITWWWCDALFMAPPALAKLARITGDRSYLDLNDRLFAETHELLYDQGENLFARDASYLIKQDGSGKHESNGKKVFWSRGNGWVLGGLVRLLEELPRDHPKRQFYVDLYKKLCERTVSLQQPDGLWRSSLLDPGSYPGGEASGSGFDVYAIAWGINNKVLDRTKYRLPVTKAWRALNTLVQPDGRVGWTQPIGADPRRNFSEESWEVYGAGAYLLAASEVIKL